MFSDIGCALNEDTVEYAWLLEFQMGKLCGKLSAPQLHAVVASLETLVLLVDDSENELNSPKNVSLMNLGPVAQKSKSAAQNISQNVQQTIQQFLQPKSSSSTSAKGGSQGAGALGKIEVSDKSHRSMMRKSEPDKSKQAVEKTQQKPKVDEMKSQNVHKLKYKFLRLAIDSVDLWLVESGTALQLWVSYWKVRVLACVCIFCVWILGVACAAGYL